MTAAILTAWLQSWPERGELVARPCPVCRMLYTQRRAALHAAQHIEEMES